MSQDRAARAREAFRRMHDAGTHVVPNPWDLGSARLLEHLGFEALATTSSGFAASLGRADQQVTREELVAHVTALCDAVDVPVTVDAESGYGRTPDDVALTVQALASAGAGGVSIEDYDARLGAVMPADVAVARVAAAAAACDEHGMVLTARAENLLYGVHDLDDTVARLSAYRDAGAGVLYAPGLVDLDAIRRVVAECGGPVNVLALPDGPSVPDLAAAGVRRVTTGGSLAWVAYGALVAAAQGLLDDGSSGHLRHRLPAAVRAAAFTAADVTD